MFFWFLFYGVRGNRFWRSIYYIVVEYKKLKLGEHKLVRSFLFSLMSFLSDIFAPKFSLARLGNYLVTNFGDYVAYMKTSCTRQDPFKWGGFLEILAASIMYSRPVNVHVMDIAPEYVISFDKTYMENDPILLSYEGRNHYNVLQSLHHRYLESRPGAEELVTLSAAVLRKVRLSKEMPTKIVTNGDLDTVLENKKRMLANQREN